MANSKCPVCEKQLVSETFVPFCSQRCANVDLSRWLNGAYTIPGEALDQAESAPSYASKSFED